MYNMCIDSSSVLDDAGERGMLEEPIFNGVYLGQDSIL